MTFIVASDGTTTTARKMNPEVKAKWLAALRDPEARQTDGALKTDEGNCCLGVLSDVAVADGIISPPVRGEMTEEWSYEGHAAFPPKAVIEWAGLPEQNPVVVGETDFGPRRDGLSAFNDEYGYDFAAIANLIEAQL